MKPLISIIIPCYNDSLYIKQSIDSALNQTYKNKEVIVVDDGSNIETKNVLRNNENRITKLITQINKGQSAARNVGIQEAKGDYILVLDSDDYFEASFCEKAIEVFIKNEELKIVTCQAKLISDNGSPYIFTPKGGGIKNFLCSNNALGTSMFKKQNWLICEGYDESMRNGFEDWEFFIRLLAHGGKSYVIQEPLFNYRKRSVSTTTIANKKKYELLKYIYLKHKRLYVDNYELIISHLLNKIEREELEKVKKEKSLEHRIGYIILRPIRFIKRLLS